MPRIAPLLSLLLLSLLTSTARATPSASPEVEVEARAAAPEPEYADLVARAPAQVITRCTVPNTVALTFDDGPYIYTREIVRQLEAVGGKATFFVNGNNWDCIYNSDKAANVKYAYDRGHQIGSHTWAHKYLNSLTWDQIHDEMWRVELALSRITGGVPAFMRPPYGEYNNLVREAAGIRNQSLVLWDFDSGDSTGSSVTAQKNAYTALANRHPSTILSLEHEVYESTVNQVLPHAIAQLSAKGYRFVTVADCLGTRKYQRTGPAGVRDSNWHC